MDLINHLFTEFGMVVMISIFFFIIYKILKKDRTTIKIVFSGYYIITAIGFIVEFILNIYLFVGEEIIVGILYKLSLYLVTYALVPFLVFFISYQKEEVESIPKKRWAILIVYAVLFLLFFFNPGYAGANESSGWAPLLDLTYYVIFFILLSSIVVPIYYYIIKILGKFEDKMMKRRWMLLIFGFSELMFSFYYLEFTCFMNDSLSRSIAGFLTLILLSNGAYLIYYAVIRKYVK
ncbi:MAG: hypothetical protein JW891_04790 [Candidatus Lokiarchaeota archaeon]|nr:hypothetical protein [Candidatus Lokiarchaeota archaeon]